MGGKSVSPVGAASLQETVESCKDANWQPNPWEIARNCAFWGKLQVLVAKNFKISKCFGCFVPFFFGAFMTSNVLKRLQTGLHRCDRGKRGNFCTKFRWERKLPEFEPSNSITNPLAPFKFHTAWHSLAGFRASAWIIFFNKKLQTTSRTWTNDEDWRCISYWTAGDVRANHLSFRECKNVKKCRFQRMRQELRCVLFGGNFDGLSASKN